MFIWDEKRRAKNLQKHGVDLAQFDRFDWDSAVFLETEFIDGEERERVIGLIEGRHAIAVYTERFGVTRLISLRPATPSEIRRWKNERR